MPAAVPHTNAGALAVTFADVEAAAARLKSIAHRTPALTSPAADALTHAQVFFKCENLQRTGAFKFRGAYNTLAQFSAEQRRAGVVAFSSGNHAQAVALSACLLKMPATLVMPQDAPTAKIEATRGYGAEIVLYDRYTEDREAISSRLAAERGMTLVPPYNHPQVMAGQGTAALELVEEVGALDVLLVCVGGGGLISGCATAVKAVAPGCRVIGVEPATGNDVQQSLAAGRIVTVNVPKTIADGAQTQSPGTLTFPIIQAYVERVLTVTDTQLISTMRFFAERMKLVVEPTGCLAAAAILQSGFDVRGLKVGVIVSGGNIDVRRYGELLAGT